MKLLFYIQLSVAVAIAIIATIHATGIDLQTTYTDVWISNSSDHLGIDKSAFGLTVWIDEKASTIEEFDHRTVKVVPIRVSNSGNQSVGNDVRPWKLNIKTKNRTSIRLREIETPQTNVHIIEVDERSKDRIGLQVGLLYPEEVVEIFIELTSSIEDVSKSLSVEVDLPIEPEIRITRFGPDPGPITKFGNVIFLVSLAALGLIYVLMGLSWFFEDQYGRIDWGEWGGIALLSLGSLSVAIIHAVAVTKIVLLFASPFM